MFQYSPGISREDGLDGGIDGELKAAVRTYLANEDEVSAVLLFAAIRGLARRTVHGGSRSEREGFIEACPADILCRRESTGTSRLELFDLDHPFIPWVRTVLSNLWISHLDVLRRAIVNTDLLGGMEAKPDGEGDADVGDLPSLTEDGLFTPAVVARMLASTKTLLARRFRRPSPPGIGSYPARMRPRSRSGWPHRPPSSPWSICARCYRNGRLTCGDCAIPPPPRTGPSTGFRCEPTSGR